KEYDQNGLAFTAGTPYTPSGGGRITAAVSPVPPQSTPLYQSGPNSNTTVTLVWPAVSDANFAGYHLYQSTVSGVYSSIPTATITPASAAATHSPMTTWTTVLPVGGTYYFIVKSFDTGGNESVASAECTVTVTGFAARTPSVP